MAQRKSTGLVNFMADSGSARTALANSRVAVYTELNLLLLTMLFLEHCLSR